MNWPQRELRKILGFILREQCLEWRRWWPDYVLQAGAHLWGWNLSCGQGPRHTWTHSRDIDSLVYWSSYLSVVTLKALRILTLGRLTAGGMIPQERPHLWELHNIRNGIMLEETPGPYSSSLTFESLVYLVRCKGSDNAYLKWDFIITMSEDMPRKFCLIFGLVLLHLNWARTLSVLSIIFSSFSKNDPGRV